jgi:sulfide:quinone oxidoreductase
VSDLIDREMRVVIVGGGVAALEAALALQALAGSRVGVEVVAPEPQFYYRPLSVAAPFDRGELRRYDLGALLARAGALLTLGTVTAVDAGSHEAHTADGAAFQYDALLVACGALPQAAVEGALTFRGPADMERVAALLSEAESGIVDSIAFSIPGGSVWGLPGYELALLTAAWLEARGRRDVSIVITTPEEAPLELFGPEASFATARLLEDRGIEVRTRARALAFREGELLLASGETLPVGQVVAMPRLEGPHLAGLPQTRNGFIPIDRHCNVEGLPGVYAAGDITTFPVKQGGIAAQQADVAAQAIALAAGADVIPQPFRPVLRGMLLTGSAPQFMRHDLSHPDETPAVSLDELWWPPAKIAGHYLGPFILSLDDTSVGDFEAREPSAGVAVHVELDPDAVTPSSAIPDDGEPAVAGETVGDLPTAPLLVVAPEDTLGEVAERMRDLDVGSGVVVAYGKTIGIITTRDMLEAFASRVHSSEARVRAWMTAHPVTVRAGQSPAAAAALMTEHDIHHLPIVDESGHAIAILGLRDVVTPMGQHRNHSVR